MSHNRNDRDRHRRWGRRGWNDWAIFGLPYPYAYPYTTAQYALAPPVVALPPAPVYQAPVYQAPVYQAPVANLAGIYRVVAPAGLNVRDRPDIYSNVVAVYRPGTEVQVVSAAGNGWVRTSDGRYLCMTCAEGPGGPWLVPVSAGPFQVAAPSSNATFFGQDPGGVIVSPLDSGIGTVLGFKPRKIRGHKKRTVVARPTVVFQATDLRIPRHVAKHFDIYEIRVGNLSLMASRDPIPAEMYSSDGCGFPSMSTDFPPVVPGQHIFLTVKNRSGSSHRFRAGFAGRALI